MSSLLGILYYRVSSSRHILWDRILKEIIFQARDLTLMIHQYLVLWIGRRCATFTSYSTSVFEVLMLKEILDSLCH